MVLGIGWRSVAADVGVRVKARSRTVVRRSGIIANWCYF